ncbi:MAG: alpha/beta fold hydrolase, partial [bacterium]
DIFAADLVAFIETLGLAPVHLVGHSRGSNIALLVARDHRALVRSIVLGEGGSAAILALSPEASSLPQDTFPQQAREAFRQGDIESAARITVEGIVGAGAYEKTPPEQRRLLMDNIAREFAVRPAGRPATSSPPLTCNEARQIAVPTLVMMGERTSTRSRLMTEQMRKCMPGSEYAVLPAATHALHLENPSGFNAIVLEFLARRAKSGEKE